mgnify:CR=1 FL=1
MKTGETKTLAFKRLATNRANNILNKIRLLGNLSNPNNYSYTSDEVQRIFRTIDEELKLSKARFNLELRRKQKNFNL